MVVACGGFEESLRSCEDWDLWIRLLFRGADICPVPLVGAYYRQSPGSMSRNKVRMCQTRTQVLLRTLIQLRQAPPVPARWGMAPTQIERTVIRPRIREELLHAAFLLRERGNYTASLAHYLASIWHGQWNRSAVLGIGKLLPHWLIKRWGRPGR
jgi:hypothetical protein